MPTAAWPASLPDDVFLQGYDEAFADNIIESPQDSGKPRRMRRFTKAPRRPLSCTIEMGRTQVQTLDTFYHATLLDGTLPFTWTHPRTLAAVTLYFKAGNPPRPKPNGTGVKWIAQLEMEID